MRWSYVRSRAFRKVSLLFVPTLEDSPGSWLVWYDASGAARRVEARAGGGAMKYPAGRVGKTWFRNKAGVPE